jgi:isopentenyldiphosphate isomerase
MRIPIVNEKDEVICFKERKDVLPTDIYRVSSLWIENSKGKVLLAQRVFTKKHDPGKWGPAVAGTVEEGETYESNIIKEMEEELGLTNINFVKDTKRLTEGHHRFFRQRFIAKIDVEIEELKIQEDEVAAVKWFNMKELKELILNKPDMFVPSMEVSARELL